MKTTKQGNAYHIKADEGKELILSNGMTTTEGVFVNEDEVVEEREIQEQKEGE